MRINPLAVTLAFVAGLVIVLVIVLADSTYPDMEAVTTSDTTPTTWLESQPSLGERFDEYRAAVESHKRVMKTHAMPLGAPYPTDHLLERLARCETGGAMDQRATSRSGRYLSFFQWELATWHSIGGTGDPRDHSYGEQARLARALILRAGWGQFPKCSRLIGAR